LLSLETLEVHRRKEHELAFHVVVEASINGHRASHSSKMVRGINPGSGRVVAYPDRTAFFWDYFRIGGQPGVFVS
jgi:hypothetical protein